MPILALLACVAGLLATSGLVLLLSRRRIASPAVYSLCLLFCLIALGIDLATLTGHAGGDIAIANLAIGLPQTGASFRVDGLAAFFLAIVDLGAIAASLFALGYGRHETAPQRVLPFYPAFLAALHLTVLADDAFTFLLSWEFMSLSSWALVLAHHRHAENRHAAFVYLAMASFGTLALLLAFGLIAGGAGSYSFDVIRAADPLSPGLSALAVCLALLGAGSKAGLVPLHVWLPLAHPAAPSHVSALMSGVMTKVAVYGFLRIVFDLVPGVPWWFAILVLGLGAITAVLGVLHAIVQDDIKRLLAYSTVENIGIVFLGLGLALAFQSADMKPLAALALSAALLHAFNHALFKSLLFFAAGAVLNATGTRRLDSLGGLIHRMPLTASAFLVGCLAISGLPPLNGFAGEWLMFQAILQSPALPDWGTRILIPAVGGMLALTAALALACFVRLYGIAFLGRARSSAAGTAVETDRFSLAAMAILAALCLFAGVLPGLPIDMLAAVSNGLIGDRLPPQSEARWLAIAPLGESRSSYNGLMVAVFILLSVACAALAAFGLGSRGLRRAAPWDCGFPDPSPATQYSAGSMAQPIRRVFGSSVFAARERVDMPPPGDPRAATLHLEMRDLVWDGVYLPIARATLAVATWLNRAQFLTIRRYLSLVFIALVGLLLVLALWP